MSLSRPLRGLESTVSTWRALCLNLADTASGRTNGLISKRRMYRASDTLSSLIRFGVGAHATTTKLPMLSQADEHVMRVPVESSHEGEQQV